MKFLQVATFAWPDHFGGAERVIGEVCARLVGRGHEVTLLTARVGSAPADERRGGVHVLRYEVDRDSPARFYRSVFHGVRGALRDPAAAGADVMHVHQILSGVAVLAPGGAGRLPALLSFYAPYSEEYLARFRDGHPRGGVPARAALLSSLFRRGDRYLLRRCRQVLALSEFSRQQVAALSPEAAARTTVAPPGVDLQRFRPAPDRAARAAAAARCGLPPGGPPLLLSVRRLVPRMGLPDLIDACRQLRERGLDVRLALAGEGEQRAELERLAAAAGLGERVRFLGSVPDDVLPDLYRAADVFVLPTRSLEGFGMATAEALASGLPVVATRAGASTEVLAGVAGSALVPAADPSALADALAPLLSDEASRQRAAQAARARAEGLLSWDRHIDAVEAAARRTVAS